MTATLVIIVVLVVIGFVTFIGALSRFQKCPPDKILVVSGQVGKRKGDGGKKTSASAKCIHGGMTLVWPVIQSYTYMDLTPIAIDIPLTGALSKQNIRINVPSKFTVGISTDPNVMINAAERLLGLTHEQIKDIAEDIILGQLRVVIATMDIEEVNADRDKFISNVESSVENELKKVGLRLINVNVKDLTDESGYIEALGKEAAAEAINNAKKSVAEKNRDGDIGEANADQDRRTQVAAADAKAVQGENLAKITKAKSDADYEVAQAAADKEAKAAKLVQEAAAKEEGYAAQQKAELARAEKDRATQKADVIVPTEIAKEQVEIAAEAEAEKLRREAKGQGDATFNKMEGEARGILAIGQSKAEAAKLLVNAFDGNPQLAITYQVANMMPELMNVFGKAISDLPIEKIVVMDGMGGDGTPTTAKWLSGLVKAMPGIQEFAKIANLQLPEFLGTMTEDTPIPDTDEPLTGEEVTATTEAMTDTDTPKTVLMSDPEE